MGEPFSESGMKRGYQEDYEAAMPACNGTESRYIDETTMKTTRDGQDDICKGGGGRFCMYASRRWDACMYSSAAFI